MMKSLPARERGLKHPVVSDPTDPKGSLPARERGLKQEIGIESILLAIVAPRTGAWIETRRPGGFGWRGWVAPRTGAWIETSRLSGSSSLR